MDGVICELMFDFAYMNSFHLINGGDWEVAILPLISPVAVGKGGFITGI